MQFSQLDQFGEQPGTGEIGQTLMPPKIGQSDPQARSPIVAELCSKQEIHPG